MKKLLLILFCSFATLACAEFPSQEKPLVIILLGPPGAGKGTHATPLSQELHLPHISSGDLFRENLRNNTTLGQKAQKYIDQGQLVPDALVVDMVFSRISLPDCQNGYILDGFPRTLNQAKILESKINPKSKVIALNFSVPDSLLIERVIYRQVCQDCSASFHTKYAPPKKENVCDHCGGKLYTRSDDTAETLKKRLVAYHQSAQPVADFYDDKNQLYDVNSQKTKQEVYEEIRQTIQAVMLSMKKAPNKEIANK